VYGKVLRVNDDGTIPKDNPFVGPRGARVARFSPWGTAIIWDWTVSPTGVVLNCRGGAQRPAISSMSFSPATTMAGRKVSFGRDYAGPRNFRNPRWPTALISPWSCGYRPLHRVD